VSKSKSRSEEYKISVKGCDSNFEVNTFQILKTVTNETSTLH